jgi:hypothetical protein
MNPEQGFGFPREHITTLVGWPEDAATRPSYENIVAGFEHLVDVAQPGAQIMIVMAGHGVQVPMAEDQDPLDPTNPELDGLDEVFLPADVQGWSARGLDRAIRDDQIGRWLRAMRRRGANIWVVFDCCHSGSMSRGPGDEERLRSVHPHQLGIPDEAITLAVERASAARSRAGVVDERPHRGAVEIAEGQETEGSLAIFYAAQDWEETPELPRPAGSPRLRRNYYGLLSYTLTQCLQQLRHPASYRELGQLLVSRYRGERGAKGPTPLFEGDLEQQVLGFSRWPERFLLLERGDQEGKLYVDAGLLAGLAPATILEVHPPAGDERPPETILGYVRVTDATPGRAEVEVCPPPTGDEPAEAELPDLARCEIYQRNLGDTRLTLAIVRPTEDDALELAPLVEHLQSALDNLPEGVRAFVENRSAPDDVQWILRPVTIEQARQEFGLSLAGPRLLLVSATGEATSWQDSVGAADARQRPALQVYGQYAATDVPQLAAELGRDLAKIFTWQNVWRIADAAYASDPSGETHGMVFETRKLKQVGDPGELLTDSWLQPGQILEYRFRNEGNRNLWVTALFLDARFGIDVYFSRSLKAGQSLNPILVQITDESSGIEGMVVIAVAMDAVRQQPSYEFLNQGPLGTDDPQSRSAATGAESPFELLLRAASAKGYATRGQRMLVPPSNPVVLSKSWITLPSNGTK